MCTHSRVRCKKVCNFKGTQCPVCSRLRCVTPNPSPTITNHSILRANQARKKLQIILFIVEAMTVARNDYFYRGMSDSHARTLLKNENGGEVPGACDDV